MTRRHLIATLSSAPEPRLTLQTRPPRPDDREQLAAVMLDAYRDTVDADGDETLEVALDEVDRFFAGRSGTPLLANSRVAYSKERIVAAALVGLFEDRPLIAYLFTDSAWKGRGVATGLMAQVMRSLEADGHGSVHLWVTAGNEPAERIYEALGFTDLDD